MEPTVGVSQKLDVSYAKPFDLFAKYDEFQECSHFIERLRTYRAEIINFNYALERFEKIDLPYIQKSGNL